MYGRCWFKSSKLQIKVESVKLFLFWGTNVVFYLTKLGKTGTLFGVLRVLCICLQVTAQMDRVRVTMALGNDRTQLGRSFERKKMFINRLHILRPRRMSVSIYSFIVFYCVSEFACYAFTTIPIFTIYCRNRHPT